jgi:hypothetical protein
MGTLLCFGHGLFFFHLTDLTDEPFLEQGAGENKWS